MQIYPYLSFVGTAQEAIALYAQALDGTIEQTSHYSEYPDMLKDLPANWLNKVVHISMRAGDVVIMAADILPGHGEAVAIEKLDYPTSPISLSINCTQ